MPAKKRFKNGDVIVALSVVALIMIMILPLPTDLISVLIIINFSLSLLILLITLYIGNPLEFSVFPSVLLVMSLLDLALNISITRMILLKGDAGAVVHAFGNTVVGGNVIVGFVVFAIITIVQFIVITKGAERIAEVGARFTLDAMPGKQMSIDADLSAGLITNEDARRRRKEIEDEADFYGAMDGASKFVKGNVIAAVVIIFINIIGGMVMGYVRGGMPIDEIMRVYTILTIGEGLVAQIPALLVSVAMGIVVTRAASKSDMGSDFTEQLTRQPKPLKIVAGFLALLGIIGIFTELPAIVFFILAFGLNYVSDMVKNDNESLKVEEQENAKTQAANVPPLYNIVKIHPVEVEIGYGLLNLIDENKKGNLLDRLKLVRENISKELGFLFPNIRIRDNSQLDAASYVIKIKSNEVASGEIMIGHFLAMSSRTTEQTGLSGIPTNEPTFGLPALWIVEKEKPRAEAMGYTVVDSVTVLATHLTEIMKMYAHEIFGRKELSQLVDIVKTENPSLIEELLPNTLSQGDIELVLKNLLRERLPIRDVETIFETLANNGKKIKDTDMLTELVRESLSRSICKQFQNGKNNLTVVALDPRLEKLVAENVKTVENEVVYTIDPALMQRMMRAIGDAIERLLNISSVPVLVCSPNLRIHMKKLTERVIPNLNVVSYNEIDPLFNVESVGVVSMPQDDNGGEKNMDYGA